MKLREGDRVVGADSITAQTARALDGGGNDDTGADDGTGGDTDGADATEAAHLRLLTITEAGYGKRTEVDEFTARAVAGQGVRAHKMHARIARKVVNGFLVGDEDHLLRSTTRGSSSAPSVREHLDPGPWRDRRAGHEPRR